LVSSDLPMFCWSYLDKNHWRARNSFFNIRVLCSLIIFWSTSVYVYFVIILCNPPICGYPEGCHQTRFAGESTMASSGIFQPATFDDTVWATVSRFVPFPSCGFIPYESL
jgi:hypothetical protein